MLGVEALEAGCLGGDAAVLVALQRAHGDVALAGQLEDQADAAGIRGRGEGVADFLLVVPAGDRAIEREAERVDDRALARAGRPDEREELDVGEVDLRLVPVRAEAVENEPDRAHVPLLPAAWTPSRAPGRLGSVVSGDCTSLAEGTVSPGRNGIPRPQMPRAGGNRAGDNRAGDGQAVPRTGYYSGAGQAPVISAAIFGDPMPVAMSKPGVVG